MFTAEDALRSSTLGFHLPRPGRRNSPRDRLAEIDRPRVEQLLAMAGLRHAEITATRVCGSRRLVVLVDFADGSSALIKCADNDTVLTNDYESVRLQLLHDQGIDAELSRALPTILAHNASIPLLVLDAINPCRSLRDLVCGARQVPEVGLRGLGRALGGLHSVPTTRISILHPDWLLVPPVPLDTILDPVEYSLGCGLEFDSFLAAMQELESEFRGLHESWNHDYLVHFDLRDDNVLFGSSPEFPVRIIDWEVMGFGDRHLDVGFVVGQLVLPWLEMRCHDSATGLEALRITHWNVATFLDAYERSSERPLEVECVAQYAGVSLLLLASTRLQQLGSLGRQGHVALLFGKRFVADPGRAVAFIQMPRG